MAYNVPYSHAMHGQPFYGSNFSSQPIYRQEDMMDFESAWIENIDPLLRQAQVQESNLSWQQQPLQRFITEPERAFFTARPLPARPHIFPGLNRPSEGIPSLPQATRTRVVSPSPSSQELNSQCSSARSPAAAENDWLNDGYYSAQQDEYSLPSATSHLTQGLPDLWTERSQVHTFPQLPGYSCVSLNQVQGIPDPQEVAFEADEGYVDMDKNIEYAIEVGHHTMKSDDTHSHSSYRHSSDEGLGASIKDGGSPDENGTILVDHEITTDVDADADAEGEDEIVVTEQASDTEYSPRSTRTRKRRPSKTASPPAVKRGRVTKTNPKSKSPYSCKSCNHAPFKDAATLQRHVNSSHTRAFVCVFGFAGCGSTFASKNEWKRHVSSQHLNLSSWVCEQGACGKVQNHSKKEGGGFLKGSEFNRKDLFTQHLRRMHTPFAIKRQNKKNLEWEERLKELQVSCLRVKRQPPMRLGCPLQGCDGFFEGSSCWDDRMEHVGKHLEKAAASAGANKLIIEQQDDHFLVNWALKERIIEQMPNGGFKLCGAWFEKIEDEDADGEYE